MFYTYLIGWRDLNLFYYGVRYAESSRLDDIETNRYKTSSVYVAEVYAKHGMPDIIQIRKVLSSAEEARAWEKKVLRRIGAAKDPRFLNRTDHNMAPFNRNATFPFQYDEVQEKVEKTFQEKYGGKGSASDVIKERVFATNKSRYGVHHTLHLPSVIESRERASLEKYGTTNPFFSKDFQESLINPMTRPEIRAKLSKTFQKKSQSEWNERAAKTKETSLAKYGTKCPMNAPEIQAQIKENNLLKYGVENYAQSAEFKQLMETKKLTCPYGCRNNHRYDIGNFTQHMKKCHNWSKEEISGFKDKENSAKKSPEGRSYQDHGERPDLL